MSEPPNARCWWNNSEKLTWKSHSKIKPRVVKISQFYFEHIRTERASFIGKMSRVPAFILISSKRLWWINCTLFSVVYFLATSVYISSQFSIPWPHHTCSLPSVTMPSCNLPLYLSLPCHSILFTSSVTKPTSLTDILKLSFSLPHSLQPDQVSISLTHKMGFQVHFDSQKGFQS